MRIAVLFPLLTLLIGWGAVPAFAQEEPFDGFSSYYEELEEESGAELIDKISAGDGEDELIEKIEISRAIGKLNERERKIVILRYFRDRTQSEIAKDLGVSQVQVSRLENKILEKMRTKL